MQNAAARKTRTLLLVLVVVAVWAVFSLARSSDPFQGMREMRRSLVGLGRGELSAPDSTAFTALALVVGAVVLLLGTFALRRRLRAGRKTPAPPPTASAMGCAGLAAGAVVFTLLAPILVIGVPWFPPLVGAAFGVRAFSLLPEKGGRPARSRKVLLLGVAVYWFLYAAYESAMRAWSATVSGAIRADIVVFFPLLFLVTAAGVWLSFDRWSKTSSS